MADDYSYGPPPLTDEEVAHVDDLFQYSNPRVRELILIIVHPGTDDKSIKLAKAELAIIRGAS